MPGGRPKKKIDIEQLKKLAERLWSDEQLGAFFNIHKQNIRRRFATEVDSSRHIGKAKLVDLLWSRAVGQNGKAGSDRILEHCANRFLGPIKSIVQTEELQIKDKQEAVDKLRETADRLEEEIDSEKE